MRGNVSGEDEFRLLPSKSEKRKREEDDGNEIEGRVLKKRKIEKAENWLSFPVESTDKRFSSFLTFDTPPDPPPVDSKEKMVEKVPFTMNDMNYVKISDSQLSQPMIYSFESDSDSDNENPENSQKFADYVSSVSPSEKAKRDWKRKFFACQKNPGEMVNLNAHITEKLSILESNCSSKGDKWRSFAYNKAIRILTNLKYKVETKDQASKVFGIGKSISDKIGEIIETGNLRRIEEEKNDEELITYKLFSNVFGAGPATARKWYQLGYRTLGDVSKNEELTYQQETGIKYYEEFLIKIPRAEVEQIGQIVIDTAHSIDPDLKVVITGSYRRGRSECGDIDILMTHKITNIVDGVLFKILTLLETLGLLTDHLTKLKPDISKYMGVAILPNQPNALHRRIDIKIYPKEEWACALFYFTGSGHFNRSVRLWARKQGMSLSEHALVPRYNDDDKGDPIPLKNEKDIFIALGLDYKTPQERDI
eukprot:TRINITY_DN10776_c0_g1_i1.p1 TRINITY_DN10776_c0_g1~~TRINITY_DN10776_c0_g1_i1.p1  ORF type:complete len:479 (+),score=110.14 TRINITY_DN10776_c0_g1_i1:464-1900(+)